MSGRVRAWCFTLNNYTPEDRNELSALYDEGGVKYLVYQPERGQSGTPHLQGYIVFVNARTPGGVRQLFGKRGHWEQAHGSAESNIAYCTKESTRDGSAGFEVVELGARLDVRGSGQGRGHRTDVEVVADRVKSGDSLAEIAQDHPKAIVLHARGLAALQALCQQRRDAPPSVYWLWGPTGTGKSRAANEESPDAYWKDPCSSWWDGYDGKSDVIIDDYRRDFCTFAALLRLFDRYPLQLQIKGGTTNMTARRIYITTPKDPQNTWEGRTAEDIGQLMRRITLVKHYPGTESVPVPRLPGLFLESCHN